jgi:hypothetical protein
MNKIQFTNHQKDLITKKNIDEMTIFDSIINLMKYSYNEKDIIELKQHCTQLNYEFRQNQNKEFTLGNILDDMDKNRKLAIIQDHVIKKIKNIHLFNINNEAINNQNCIYILILSGLNTETCICIFDLKIFGPNHPGVYDFNLNNLNVCMNDHFEYVKYGYKLLDRSNNNQI